MSMIEDMTIYISIPIMSLVMDMKGPVASAGGTKVPNTDAKITTDISDSDTASVVE